MLRPKRIYLAAPYTHESSVVMNQRFEEINKMAAGLLTNGFHVFSPISHAHPINEIIGLGGGFIKWMDYDLSIIALWADEVWVMQMDGWDKSVGVQCEINFAIKLGMSVIFIGENSLKEHSNSIEAEEEPWNEIAKYCWDKVEKSE
jgi:nucleoside 2-deoxyribosyltransferase